MQEVAKAIWEINSGKPGKTITILGGTHGNERTGIEVVKEFVDLFKREEMNVAQGKVFLILGNIEAIKINERGSKPHQDLNRCFHEHILGGAQGETFEEQRAAIIAPFLEQSDIVLDLHADNKPAEPFLACLDSQAHREVYQWFTCDKVLADPKFLLGGAPVTTDEFTEAHGGIGICYETGLDSDTSRVHEVLEDIKNILRQEKILDGNTTKVPTEKEVYEISESIIMTNAGFTFADGMGGASWQEVNVGDVVGHMGDQPVKVLEDGVIVFPRPEKYWHVGKPVGYLAKRVS